MADTSFARTPEPPYVAVIFSNRRTPGDAGYAAAAERMASLARSQPGFLGLESARGADGFGITVSYWRSEADALAWKAHVEHLPVQARGRQDWYAGFELRVARVERARSWRRAD